MKPGKCPRCNGKLWSTKDEGLYCKTCGKSLAKICEELKVKPPVQKPERTIPEVSTASTPIDAQEKFLKLARYLKDKQIILCQFNQEKSQKEIWIGRLNSFGLYENLPYFYMLYLTHITKQKDTTILLDIVKEQRFQINKPIELIRVHKILGNPLFALATDNILQFSTYALYQAILQL